MSKTKKPSVGLTFDKLDAESKKAVEAAKKAKSSKATKEEAK